MLNPYNILRISYCFYKLATIGLVNSILEAANILGISPDASIEEIDKAFKLKIFEFHPDRNTYKDTSLETKRVIAARDLLKNKDNIEPGLDEEIQESEEDLSPSYEDICELRK